MLLRKMNNKDKNDVYRMIYNEWGEGSYSSFCRESEIEENFGTRFILADRDHKVVSSLISYPHEHPSGIDAFIVGSVITPPVYRNNGYATILLKKYISFMEKEHPDCLFFLYSDILPSFYSRIGFKELPDSHQKVWFSTCMVRCKSQQYAQVISFPKSSVPDYYLFD